MPRVIFVMPGGTRRVCEGRAGETLLQVAWRNRIGIEGACEGVMACSTCHVIVDPAFADRLPLPGEEEADMLDLAWGLSPTSRLGCQIVLTETLDGLVVRLPAETRNLLDG
jgi:ferredoxin, 2Fe-2S